ncbi:CGNR zinc finger domain-containing protein [Streptomyces sp. NPDC001941]|uniref:CGNR zinc finger domain-containing protein n=1 Tax=Streptomyces sp. NPDC001941 TaxID=3154659 RepID=UPI003321CFFF
MTRPGADWNPRHSVQATARRTADLVNALAPERPDPAAVADVLRAHGEPGPLDLTPDDITQLRAAAVPLRAVLAAPDADTAAALLNTLLRDSAHHLRLTSHGGGTPWHPRLDRHDDAPWGERFLASSCLALTVLVWDQQRPPGGTCASPSCRNVFLAQSRGLERRYCSRRCATRERVAAHRRARAAT